MARRAPPPSYVTKMLRPSCRAQLLHGAQAADPGMIAPRCPHSEGTPAFGGTAPPTEPTCAGRQAEIIAGAPCTGTAPDEFIPIALPQHARGCIEGPPAPHGVAPPATGWDGMRGPAIVDSPAPNGAPLVIGSRSASGYDGAAGADEFDGPGGSISSSEMRFGPSSLTPALAAAERDVEAEALPGGPAITGTGLDAPTLLADIGGLGGGADGGSGRLSVKASSLAAEFGSSSNALVAASRFLCLASASAAFLG
eukprot:scaffold10329_cov33-Tisochrysis_lutea.AAC.1